jgi:hypothetical protein
MRRLFVSAVMLGAFVAAPAYSQEDPWKLKAFVDTYSAWDMQQPRDRLRAYTTQPLHHNTLGLNMALLEASYSGESWRGQLGLQTGSYVASNLAAEPALLQPIYAANAGIRLWENLWLDAGVFPSHIGFESILSADNWTYSRSLVADYSPYYESGLKLSGAWGDWNGALLVLNGWQNIAETNNNKAVGSQLQYRPIAPLLLNWSTFLGNESVNDDPRQLRFFNNFYAQYQAFDALDLALLFDVGVQGRTTGGAAPWWGGALLARWRIAPMVALGARVEHLNDREQVVVTTGTANGFQVTSASVNVDVTLAERVLWRTEGRIFGATDALYPTASEQKSATNALVVSSLSVRF